ncbi:hypothetical protein [Pseudomonas sp.]|uniref:hypothetical protein n=1 Tax=Pseudomonas sp. TaxID=306 RepID=UPI0028B08EAA|nr:hypothetical protein [Pseudomonas sp.]
MLRILGRASSINVRKVLWACAEFDIAYQREDWGQGYASTDTPAFLALNPWAHHMAILELQLTRTGAFVAGERFTLADIPIGLSVQRWFATPFEQPRLPAVTAYYERLSLRPGYLAHGRNGLP